MISSEIIFQKYRRNKYNLRQTKSNRNAQLADLHFKVVKRSDSGRKKVIQGRHSDLHKKKRGLEKKYMMIKYKQKNGAQNTNNLFHRDGMIKMIPSYIFGKIVLFF